MALTLDPMLKGLHKKDGLQLWRIKNFKLEPVPPKEVGIMYSGDAYIALNNNRGDWDVHFWLGNDASSDEVGVAVIKTVEIDNMLGGFAVQHREVQGNESAQFLSYFPDGIRYKAGGYDTGYQHVEEMFANWTKKLYQCKGKRNVRCQQVECTLSSLNLGDVFILDLGKDIYVWMPPESGRLERIKGMTIARSMAHDERNGASTVHLLDEVDWKTDEVFWGHFGGVSSWRKVSKAKDDDEDYWKANNRQLSLWRVCDASGDVKVTKVATGEVNRSLLDSKDAFILDAGLGGVYVWVGKDCTQDERTHALDWGAKFLSQQKLPLSTDVTRILESYEPASFTQWFGGWSDEKKRKAFVPRLHQVSDASGRLRTEEIANFTQESLDGDDVMILDALHTLYVWVGAGATKNEREGAEAVAKEFLKTSKLPRHQKTVIETLFQGHETPIFKKFFPKWDDELFANETRSLENMRKLLFK